MLEICKTVATPLSGIVTLADLPVAILLHGIATLADQRSHIMGLLIKRGSSLQQCVIPPALYGVGGLGRLLFQPPSSPSGRGSPLPLPPPLVDGGSARGWSVQDDPRQLQERLKEPKMTSKMAQDSPGSLTMAPKMLQEAPRPPQDGSKSASNKKPR